MFAFELIVLKGTYFVHIISAMVIKYSTHFQAKPV